MSRQGKIGGIWVMATKLERVQCQGLKLFKNIKWKSCNGNTKEVKTTIKHIVFVKLSYRIESILS